MANKKYAGLDTLRTFLANLKDTFASLTHTHSYDDLRNKPFYEGSDYSSILTNGTSTVNFYEWGGGVYGAAITDAPQVLKQDVSHKVIWDGVEYTMTCTYGGDNEAGNPITCLGAPYGDYSDYPFGIDSYQTASGTYEFSIHTNSTASTHTIDILELGSKFVTLDDRFISDNIARTVDVDTAIENINTTISGKADINHTHTISNVTNLQTTLDSKVPTSRTINGKALSSNITLSASDVGAASSSHNHDGVYAVEGHNHDTKYDAKGTASSAVSTHNTSTSAHNDIRELINGLTTRLNTLANSDDTTLDQMSEIVAYIKNNKSLIDGITTSKVNVSDIINNLTTNVTNKPLSAAQGVEIKRLIDELEIVVNGKAATSHNHSADDITSGTLSSDRLPIIPIANGGTGATTATEARTLLEITPANISAMPAIVATSSDYDMDTILTSGSHCALYKTNVSTLGTPYKKRVTTCSTALILSYASSIVFGTQIAFCAGTDTYIRYLENEIIGDWILIPTMEDIQVQLDSKAASSHNHSASSITSGTLTIERGGTGNTEGYVRAGQLSGSTMGSLATAEGRNTTASGDYSHAEGNITKATGISAHAEGQGTEASGDISHAEGDSTTASGDYSHAEGHGTIASGEGTHAEGRYNKNDATSSYAHIVGNGTSNSKRSNAHTLDWQGNAWFAGNIYTGGTSQNSGATMLASISPITTAEYTALEEAEATNANTLYMLTDAEEETPTQVQIITWESDD